MIRLPFPLMALATGFASVAMAQQSGWVDNQVNATMCYWEQLRASVVRDTLYLDGGDLWWIPGMSNGEYGPVNSDGNPLGLVYTLNFSTPFNSSTNISSILGTISKAPNGGAANNIAPNYYDGAMLGNDAEWFLFGGLLRKTDAYTAPRDDDVTAYQAYQYGVDKPGFRPGFAYDRLPDGMTRYIAYGGAANSPSENKAWYFSGLRSPTWGEIYKTSTNVSISAVNVSNTLITLDMTTQQQETWSNITIDDKIQGRANPELVWVPVGAQGILVALGGVVYPDFVNGNRKSSNEAASESESPKFMSTIDIYDIASGTWYQQPTIGGPAALARGCAVVAPAQDYSSFNIYYYGGYDGIHPTEDYNDDVWILSLPSFMWMKVASGKSSHARAGHKCVKPYPDQMFVIGGYSTMAGGSPHCVENGILQNFNLTSGKWMDSYDPNIWSDYGVPEMIYVMIGGTATGGATLTTPTPTGWAEPELASVFATPYPTAKISAFYPYGSAGPNNSTRPDLTQSGGSGIPNWLPPVLGVICGLMFISAICVAILLYRRRRLLRAGGTSDGGTDENGNRIISWIRGQPSENKAPTVTTSTEDAPLSPEMETGTPVPPPVFHHEMADTQVAELMDTSPRVELQDTGLTPVEVINKHTHFAPNGGSLHNSSHYSSVAQADYASSISRSSGQRGQGGYSELRPDSPPLGTPMYEDGGAGPSVQQTPTQAPRGESGVSGLSDRDRAHLRQISDTTISSMDTARENALSPEPGAAAPFNSPANGPVLSPVSPPSPKLGDGGDYITARGFHPVSPGVNSSGSPLRRSVFYEHEEDLGERR